MLKKPVEIETGHVVTEGDELYFEVRGQGQPLLMISGGGGDGDYYAEVADILSDEYKVITYDRRANALSTMNNPQNFEVSQQSRDAVAVLHAAGETSAYIFGNSSGAVIALDMAKTHAQTIMGVIVHEAPVPKVLPNADKWQRFFASCYLTAFRFGSSMGALRWILGIQVPVTQMIKAQKKALEYAKVNKQRKEDGRIDAKTTTEFLVKHELLPITNYMPDIETIKKNGVKVIIGIGQWSLDKKTWLAQIGRVLAQKLHCELVVFPGHHGSNMDMPEEWADVLRTTLRKALGKID